MMGFDCENVPTQPPKDDTTPIVATAVTTTIITPTTTTSTSENAPPPSGTSGSSSSSGTQPPLISSAANRFNVHIQQKTKYIRDMLTQHRRLQVNRDHSQLLVIVLMSVIAIGCSLAALTTSNWTCDATVSSSSPIHYGLWNTCFTAFSSIMNDTVTADNSTEEFNKTETTTIAAFINNKLKSVCAHQAVYGINIVSVEQWRIGQVSTSQGLIICGTLLYLLSIFAISFAYKFIRINNLNSVRNALVTSMCVQIISFFLQLIGFFLFIYTDRLSISIGLLFVYFGLAILATNIINFVTIEYKSFKIRQTPI